MKTKEADRNGAGRRAEKRGRKTTKRMRFHSPRDSIGPRVRQSIKAKQMAEEIDHWPTEAHRRANGEDGKSTVTELNTRKKGKAASIIVKAFR